MKKRPLFEKCFNFFKGRGHRNSINGSGGRTKSSKSRRERGEDRGTPYDSASSSNIHRGSRRHRNHHSSSGNSSSIMGGNVSSKLSKFFFGSCIIRFWVQFISAAQCGNFSNFLLLKFSVKSISGILEVQRLPF